MRYNIVVFILSLVIFPTRGLHTVGSYTENDLENSKPYAPTSHPLVRTLRLIGIWRACACAHKRAESDQAQGQQRVQAR